MPDNSTQGETFKQTITKRGVPDGGVMPGILSPIKKSEVNVEGEKFEARYRIFNITNEDQRGALEKLMTSSFEDNPKIFIRKEDTNFTKDGDYIVVISYVESFKVKKKAHLLARPHFKKDLKEGIV